MELDELRLECVKLAMEQARREATSDITRIAELQTWFYNHIALDAVGDPAAEVAGVPAATDVKRRKDKATDKPPDPFA